MIPTAPDRTDFVIILQPLEAMHLQPTSGADVINGELSAAAAVEQHHRTPLLLGVSALHFPQKFHCLIGHMLVLNAHGAKAVITLLSQQGDIPYFNLVICDCLWHV